MNEQPKKDWAIEVVERKTKVVVETVKTHKHKAAKVAAGMSINLAHDRYYLRERPLTAKEIES